MRNQDIFVCVYDVHNLDSFHEVRSFLEIYWEREANPKTMMLLGTKIDKEHRQEVSYEEGLDMAKELNMDLFFEVSAKTGQHIQRAFSMAVEHRLSHFGLNDGSDGVVRLVGQTKTTTEKKSNFC